MTKCHVAPCFDLLDLWNAKFPLMMLSALHDTDARTSGVILPSHFTLHFDCLDIRNVVPLTMFLASCDADNSE